MELRNEAAGGFGAPASPADFYAKLTERNAGFVAAAAQEALRTATILVAGCGSIGGAAVEPLARLGVQRFLLADPGNYEMNNLNRQNATVADLGRNKAEAAAERVRAINPNAEVRAFAQGVCAETVADLTSLCHIVVDGVDVTTRSGLEAKFLLHEHAAGRRLPLVTGWDMAGAQYVRVYDYRRASKEPFDGRVTRADLAHLDSWGILRKLVPARYVPLEMISLIAENLKNPDFTFPQIVCAADLFGALSTHIVQQFLTGVRLRKHIYIDLARESRPSASRWRAAGQRAAAAAALSARLRRHA